MHRREEERCVFSVSCGNATPYFELEKGIFDPMPGFVEIFIIRPFNSTVFLGRDYDPHALILGLCKDGVAIIPTIRQQIIGAYPFN